MISTYNLNILFRDCEMLRQEGDQCLIRLSIDRLCMESNFIHLIAHQILLDIELIRLGSRSYHDIDLHQ